MSDEKPVVISVGEALAALPEVAVDVPSFRDYNQWLTGADVAAAQADAERVRRSDTRAGGYFQHYLGAERQEQLIVAQQAIGALAAIIHAENAADFGAYLRDKMAVPAEQAAALEALFPRIKPLFAGDLDAAALNDTQLAVVTAIVVRSQNQVQQPEHFADAAEVLADALETPDIAAYVSKKAAEKDSFTRGMPLTGNLLNDLGDKATKIGKDAHELLMCLQAARRYGGFGVYGPADGMGAADLNPFDNLVTVRPPFPENVLQFVDPLAKQLQSGVKMYLALADGRRKFGEAFIDDAHWAEIEAVGVSLYHYGLSDVAARLGQQEKNEIDKLIAKEPALEPIVAALRERGAEGLDLLARVWDAPSLVENLGIRQHYLLAVNETGADYSGLGLGNDVVRHDPAEHLTHYLPQLLPLLTRERAHAALAVELRAERDALTAHLVQPVAEEITALVEKIPALELVVAAYRSPETESRDSTFGYLMANIAQDLQKDPVPERLAGLSQEQLAEVSPRLHELLQLEQRGCVLPPQQAEAELVNRFALAVHHARDVGLLKPEQANAAEAFGNRMQQLMAMGAREKLGQDADVSLLYNVSFHMGSLGLDNDSEIAAKVLAEIKTAGQEKQGGFAGE